jgi:O-antigen ligase
MKNNIYLLDNFIIGSLMFMMFSSAISIAGSSIGMGLAFLAWIIKMILIKISGEKISFVKVAFTRSIWTLFFAILISFIGTYNFNLSLEGLEDYLIVILLFYMVINNVKDLAIVKKLFFLGIVSIVLSSMYAFFYQKLYLGVSRIDSTFMALDFGALLLIYSIFIMIYLLFSKNTLLRNILLAFSLILVILTLIFNKSRGAWLGFIGGSFISFWFNKKKLIPIFLVLLLLIIFFMPNSIQQRIVSITDFKNNKSNITRLELWKSSLLMFKDNPINGVGINNFQEAYKSEYKQPNIRVFSHAHNTFLNFLSETGLLGLISIIYLFISILKYLYFGFRKVEDEFSKLFICGTMSSFVGSFVIQGMTESNFSKSVVGRTIWFILALSVIIIQNNETKSQSLD